MTSVIKAAALNVSQSTEECINFVRIPLGMEADLVLLGGPRQTRRTLRIEPAY
jgi:hypothetical protein